MPVNCQHCGAVLPPSAESCAYCGTVPEAVRQAKQAQQAQAAHYAAQQAAYSRAQAGAAVNNSARNAVLWGLATMTCLCSPVTAIFAFVNYSRAKEAARQAGTSLPGHARAGFWFALLGLVSFVGFWTWIIVDVQNADERMEARKVELGQKLAKADRAKLDHDTACMLAELHVLESGYGGDTNTGQFRGFVCSGALHVQGELAALDDFKFKTSSSGSVNTVSVCLKHGDRWFVDQLSTSGCQTEKSGASDAGPTPSADPALSRKPASKKPAPAGSR